MGSLSEVGEGTASVEVSIDKQDLKQLAVTLRAKDTPENEALARVLELLEQTTADAKRWHLRYSVNGKPGERRVVAITERAARLKLQVELEGLFPGAVVEVMPSNPDLGED